MNAKLIQARLIHDLGKRSFVLPNYTPANWFESDIFEITPAGYFREYEVKISRSDYIADMTKRDATETKHDKLARACFDGPSRFYFVVPEGLVAPQETPSWAGLIYMQPGGYCGCHQRFVVKAPKRHKQKISDEIVKHARGVCYYRYIELWVRRARLHT